MGEARFEMLVGDIVKLKKLLCRTAPTALVCGIVLVEIRLVPDLPILDIHIKAVCPSFGIVSDDMLTNDSPFFEIGRRQSVIFF